MVSAAGISIHAPLTLRQLESCLSQWNPAENPNGKRLKQDILDIAISRIRNVFSDDKNELELDHLGLRTLPSCLGQLKLRELHLYRNHLKEIPDYIFRISSLVILDFSFNPIRSINFQNAYLPNITCLGISNLRLASLPPSINCLVSLRELSADNNSISSVPYQIGDLKNLEELFLEHNNITKLPTTIGKLAKLQHFKLNHNSLKRLPVEICQLASLRILYVNCNQLTCLPRKIRHLTQLEELFADVNHIKILPVGICKLTHLISLNLSINEIKNFPANIGELRNLRVLSFANNYIKSFPKTFFRMHNLRECYLSSNQLIKLPKEGFEKLFQLRKLELCHNRELIKLPIALKQCIFLEKLYAEGTKVPPVQITSTLAHTAIQRDEMTPLGICLHTMSILGEWEDKLELLNSYSEREIEALCDWLSRLEGTKDFECRQKKVATIVYSLLKTVIVDDEFRLSFFEQVEANNEGCGDRASIALNEIYTYWRLHTMPPEVTLIEKLNLLIGCSKTNTLRRYVSSIVKDVSESSEIFLFYEIKYKDQFGLISAVDSMAHRQMGRSSLINEFELEDRVVNHYYEELFNFPAFIKLVTIDETFQTKWKKEELRLDEKMDSLTEKRPQGDEESEAYLEWQIKMNQLIQKRKTILHTLYKEWLNRVFENNERPSKRRRV